MCDSSVDTCCWNCPESIKRNFSCPPETTGCSKSIFGKKNDVRNSDCLIFVFVVIDTTDVDVVAYFPDDADEESQVRYRNTRVVRKCHSRPLFGVPLKEDCQEKIIGYKFHMFCLCRGDFCNYAKHLSAGKCLLLGSIAFLFIVNDYILCFGLVGAMW